MIISEKQIFQLIMIAKNHIEMLDLLKSQGKITNLGEANIRVITRLLQNIDDQQSDRLIDIKDDELNQPRTG